MHAKNQTICVLSAESLCCRPQATPIMVIVVCHWSMYVVIRFTEWGDAKALHTPKSTLKVGSSKASNLENLPTKAAFFLNRSVVGWGIFEQGASDPMLRG